MNTTGTITTLLGKVRTGDPIASDRLFELVYKDLKRIAVSILAAKSQPAGGMERTALVHAACERLLVNQKLVAENRRHFFFLFSRAMKDFLVEQAREDLAAKRGGGRKRVPLEDTEKKVDLSCANILDVHDALEDLKKIDPEAAETVMLKFFGGRTLTEIGELTGRTFSIVRRDWEYARAWLHVRLSRED